MQGFRVADSQALAFNIPKSQWLEQLLPQPGYGRLDIIEVRIPGGVRAEGLPQSAIELRQALKYLNEGDWEKAVGQCRKAIEALPDSRNLQLPPGSKFGAKADAFVNDHLKGLTDKQAKLVADELKLLWEVTSKAAHRAPQDYFKRPDAEFLVRRAMALVEYVGRSLE